MGEKHSIKVLIDGKIITLSGYESEDYLQRVAYYLNVKINDLSTLPGYRRLTAETRSTLLALNIADDYFKAKSQVESMEADIESKDQDTYDARHDLVSAQMEVERLRRETEQLKKEIERLKGGSRK